MHDLYLVIKISDDDDCVEVCAVEATQKDAYDAMEKEVAQTVHEQEIDTSCGDKEIKTAEELNEALEGSFDSDSSSDISSYVGIERNSAWIDCYGSQTIRFAIISIDGDRASSILKK